MSHLMMRTAGLTGYFELVKDLGGEPLKLISRVGLSKEWFESPDHFMPASKACELLEITASELDCDTFGLRLGQRQGVDMLGPLGLMLQHCETIEEVIEDLQKFLHVHSQAGEIKVNLQGKVVSIAYEPLVSYKQSARQLIDLSLAAGYKILSGLTSETFSLISAHFSYPEPDDKIAHEQLFCCPIVYSASENGVTLLRSMLERSLNIELVDMKRFLNRYLENQEIASRPSIDESIRILVRQLLPHGKCKIDIVSAALGVDKRTLQRRLKEVGMSFQTLVNEERQVLAKHYLDQTILSVGQISDLLGYSETSVFSRNFKTWFGLTPIEHLRTQRNRWALRK